MQSAFSVSVLVDFDSAETPNGMSRSMNLGMQDDTTPTAEFIRFYEQSGVGFGTVDIFCIGHGKAYPRIQPLIDVLLAGKDNEGRSPIEQLILIVPKTGTEESADVQAMRTRITQQMVAHENSSLKSTAVLNRLQIAEPLNLNLDTVLSIVANAPARSVVIVVNASLIRKEGVEPYCAPGADAPSLPEDVWVPQIHNLASSVAAEVSDKEVYAVLDVGRSSPHRAILIELLKSIEGVGVMGSELVNDLNSIIAEHADQWNSWLSEGRLGPVMKSIEALPSSLDSEKPFLRAQILHRAGMLGPALQVIESLPVADSQDPAALVKVARIAVDAGASCLACRFLRKANNYLETLEDLELALATAADANDRELEEQIAARFERLFPDSTALKQRAVRKFVTTGNYRGAADALSGNSSAGENRDFFLALADSLDGDDIPNYPAILERFRNEKPTVEPMARRFLIKDALQRGLTANGVELAISGIRDDSITRADAASTRILVEELFVNRKREEGSEVSAEQLQRLLTVVVRYLAANPSDGAMRVRLSRLLAVDMSGSYGLPLIAAIALEFFKTPLSLRSRRTQNRFSIEDLLAQKSIIENAFAWLEAESPVLLGRLMLPTPLLADLSPDDLVSGIAEYLQIAVSRLDDTSDATELTKWLLLGVSVAPHTSNPDQDLSMVRLVAGQLAQAGYVQQARDFAEQGLQAAGSSARRKRSAWSAMADVYHRLGNNLEALVATACALAGDPDVDIEQAYHEANGLARLLRDLGLIDLALTVHAKTGEFLDQMELTGANLDRHDFLGLQLEMARLRMSSRELSGALPDLLERAVVHAEDVLSSSDDAAPIAIMLGQLMRLVEAGGVAIPADTNAMLAALLERVSVPMANLVRVLAAKNPSADEVLALYRQTEQARYAEDVGYDVRKSALAARRLLSAGPTGRNPANVAFAIELLADRATAIPGWESTARSPPPIVHLDEPAEFAMSVSTQGVSVVLAGVSEDRQLIRVIAENGVLSSAIREHAETFSVDHLNSWAEEFPYRYGVDSESPNLFYVSTERLRVSDLPDGPVVLVMDTELGQMPPNLLRVDDELAGEKRAMATTPSLSWLASARASVTTSSNQSSAWISASDKHGRTLPMIAERLRDTLAKHNIALNTEPTLPGGFGGSDLVILAAHGSITPEGRYFLRISDEGDFQAATQELASSLRNVGIVVLFVCSGGRADKHPAANTTIGLAKQLLNQGCSSVIASPWPLDARVTYHWLPTFLDELKRGSPVIDANFQANLVVAQNWGFDPAKSLAMNVFGDPLRTVRSN